MKSGKAAGQDGIPTEAMKADIYTSVEMFILYLERSGKRRRCRMIGRRDILLSYLKRETSVIVPTAEESHYYQYQEKFVI